VWDAVRGPLGLIGSAVVTVGYAATVRLLAPFPRVTLRLMPHWGRAVLWCMGVRLDVRGRVPDSTADTIWAAAHTSLLDTFAYPACLPALTVYVGKLELARIPLLAGSYRILGHLFVDRRGGRAAMQRFFDEVARVPRERPIFMHPEGTRSYSDRIAPLHRGCARIVSRTGRTVVPIASQGGEALWTAGRHWPARGMLRIAIGAPMVMRQDEDEQAFSDRLRAEMQALSEALRDRPARERLETRSPQGSPVA